MSSSISSIFASKLSVTSDVAKIKAEELVRLVELKSKGGYLSSLNLSSTSIAVMCVDMAATTCSLHVDKTMAIKLSGLQKKNYSSALKILEQMLNMKRDMSIANLSVQFGCSEARQLAIRVLKSYQDSQQNFDLNEMNAGLFNSASLYISCRKLKLKVDKTKMVSHVGIQRSVFDRLVSQMEPIATNLMKTKNSSGEGLGNDFSKSLVENIEQKSNGETSSMSSKPSSNIYDDTTEEPYHIWKERILEKAKETLALING